MHSDDAVQTVCGWVEYSSAWHNFYHFIGTSAGNYWKISAQLIVQIYGHFINFNLLVPSTYFLPYYVLFQ